jgi:uncharacterized protein
VAFSGGVDSTLLLYAACDALGKDKVFVLRGMSELISRQEATAAATLLVELQIADKQLLEIELFPLIWPEFVVNNQERCYFCKKRMYQSFQRVIEPLDAAVLLDGSNVDDLKSHRPGFRAIHELGVKTPLLDAALNKEEIRSLAKSFHLSNHNKSSNSCLATRLPEDTVIEKESLELVEKCEDFLTARNFSGCRVKPNGSDVVLELSGTDALQGLKPSVRVEIIHFFKALGFLRVLVDLKPRS